MSISVKRTGASEPAEAPATGGFRSAWPVLSSTPDPIPLSEAPMPSELPGFTRRLPCSCCCWCCTSAPCVPEVAVAVAASSIAFRGRGRADSAIVIERWSPPRGSLLLLLPAGLTVEAAALRRSKEGLTLLLLPPLPPRVAEGDSVWPPLTLGDPRTSGWLVTASRTFRTATACTEDDRRASSSPLRVGNSCSKGDRKPASFVAGLLLGTGVQASEGGKP